MEPAASIIQRLGGNAIVARVTGAHRTRVWKWQQPRGRNGGTGGVIPIEHIRPLLDYAKSIGVDLTADEFLPAEPVDEGSTTQADMGR